MDGFMFSFLDESYQGKNDQTEFRLHSPKK